MGQGRAWSPKEYEEFKAEIESGMSVLEMAAKHGRTVAAIKAARSGVRHGRLKLFKPHVPPKREDRWTPEAHKKLVHLWNNTNLTQAQIGERFGRTQGAIACQIAKLRKAGVTMVDRKVPGRGPWRGRLKTPQHVHPLVRRLFHEMNQQMTTCEEIAERVGLHHETVGKWRHRHPPDLLNLDAAFTVLGLELTVRRIKEAA